MGRFQVDRRGAVVLERGFPTRHANAPLVAGLQARKSPFWNRRDQIVAIEYRKIQKLTRHLHADGMQAHVFRAGSAKTVAIKSGHRIATAALELGAENVGGHQRNSGSSVETVDSPLLCRS